ncbi:MAG: hypothetical protein R3B84_21680 [Zavarzinella sp.]
MTTWMHRAIYLDSVKRFDAVLTGSLPVSEIYERMSFVFDNIEYCFAEGRLMDLEIFNRLDDLADLVNRNVIPPLTLVSDIAERISSRYGFDTDSITRSMWIRKADSGEYVIWIDQTKIIAESNERLFGRQ